MAAPTKLNLLLAALLTTACSDQAAREALLDRADELDMAPLEAPEAAAVALIDLGESLFFDPLLSGNRDQACSSCHSLEHSTTDGRSLSVGTAAIDVNGVRLPGPDHSFTPRNSPSLWDLGQTEISKLFWDARIARTEEGILLYDVGHEASQVARLIFPGATHLSAIQPLFPVIDRDEMRGDQEDPSPYGPNELATVFDDDFEGVWRALMARLLAEDAYAEAFEEAFPDTPLDELEFLDAALAIGAFMDARFVATDTPWDRFLSGETDLLESAQIRGATLFFGEAKCHRCHEGNLFSDQELYNYGIRPMTRGPSKLEYVDLGAQHRTHAAGEGRYAFRTPRLRNVTQTGPWMHNGAYTSLEAALAHKADPIQGLWDYDLEQLEEAMRNQVHRRVETLEDVEASMSEDVPRQLDLDERDIADLIAFLEALTSPSAESLALQTPTSVLSGLPIPEP
jgi:cytochrome c peroxidase